MGSSRLPGKVLMNIDSKMTVIHSVIDQLRYAKKIDKIVVATTGKQEDDKIHHTVGEIGIDCFRGSSEDVLDRYYQCARRYSANTVVRITCDNPLIDPTIADKVIDNFTSCDVATNIFPRSYPQGTEVEVFSYNALEKAWNNAKLPSEREHVTPYFYNNTHRFNIKNVKYHEDISNLRWTIDRKEDLEFVRNVVSKIKKRPILLQDILGLISKEPHLVDINKNYNSKEGYLKSLEEDKKFLENTK